MREVVFQLTWLDLFLITLALLSLFGNLFQFMIWWRDRKNLYRPLSSTLIGLFNDIKRKASHAFFVQNTLFQENNPHSDITTLRWEYAAYTRLSGTIFRAFRKP